MRKSIQVASAVAACGLAFVAGRAFADGMVVVAGGTYLCQNTCVVSANPGGGFTVSDSKGGWVQFVAKRIQVPGA